MTMTASLAELAGRHIDLAAAPFTLPLSRILVFGEGAGLRVHTAEYERSLADCRVIDELAVTEESGCPLQVTKVLPDRIELGGGAATVTFAGESALSISAPGTVRWRTPDGEGEARLSASESAVLLRIEQRRVRPEPSRSHAADLAATRRIWERWFAACPIVRDDLQEMTAFCWWVLGANIVSLPSLGGARIVVPSKIGYVGLWQWDAYFIALGLRHGDPALAREQLDLAFRFPTPDGQLPDVVHERGVLSSSDGLPPADRERLRRAGSGIADTAAPVPLTKPPLAAWALRQLLDAARTDEGRIDEDTLDWACRQWQRVARSQDWWFAACDLDGDGLPEYGHPYSSGLDDSPIFDGPLPTAAPDLAAYLVVQDLELAALADRLAVGDPAQHRVRADRTMSLLLDMWDAKTGRFRARAAGRRVGTDAIVGLLPLLTGRLPDDVRDALLAAMADPGRFRTTWAVPTVAVGDPDFSPERMWRGPVWINTNALLVAGLDAHGRPDLAQELAEQTVRLVIHAGGPHEYFNPLTGQKAQTATTAFGWSAALFVDLAVRLSGLALRRDPVISR